MNVPKIMAIKINTRSDLQIGDIGDQFIFATLIFKPEIYLSNLFANGHIHTHTHVYI